MYTTRQPQSTTANMQVPHPCNPMFGYPYVDKTVIERYIENGLLDEYLDDEQPLFGSHGLDIIANAEVSHVA